jgi:hypothetical protein
MPPRSWRMVWENSCGSPNGPTLRITHIETTRQAAEALRPLAGKFAATLFTVGIALLKRWDGVKAWTRS